MKFDIPKGDSKAHYVKQKFSTIADKYDLFNDIVTQGMHRYWKRYLVKKTNIGAGDAALDICCGTGDITQLLYKKVGKGGTVFGLDFSTGMLSVANHRNSENKISLVQADATVIPFKNNSFDTVTVGYGLRNLVDIHSCLKEVRRVLKPGGRFLCLEMGKVNLPIINQIFTFYFFNVVPKIGKVIYPGEDMFDYFPESSVEFPPQERLVEILLECGFEKASFTNFYFGSVAVHLAVKEK